MNAEKPSHLLNDELLLKAAKNLQSTYSKLTAREGRPWSLVPPDERKIWIRCARNAAKVLGVGSG